MDFAMVPVTEITWTEMNPRKNLDLTDILPSIKEKGVLQPIKLIKNGHGYIGVLGQRRFLATKEAGHEVIPAIIAETYEEETDMMEEILIENLHRRNFSEDEEIDGFETYVALTKDPAEAVERLALRAGINPRLIRRRLAVNGLPEVIKASYRDGTLKIGHLDQFLRVGSEKEQLLLYEEVLHPQYYNPSGAPMEVRRLKEKIDSAAIGLTRAKFKYGVCKACPSNTKQSIDLFGEDMIVEKEEAEKRGACTNPKCFFDKQIEAIREHWKGDTNRVEFAQFVPYTDYEHMYGEVKDKCVSCENFTALVEMRGAMRFDRVCMGDKTCFQEQYRVQQTNTDLSKTKEEKAEAKADARSVKHSDEFRDEFFIKELTDTLQANHSDPEMLVKLMLIALVVDDHKCADAVWSCGIFNIDAGTRCDANADPLIRAIICLKEDDLKTACTACILAMATYRSPDMIHMSLYGMQTICEWLGINIKLMWKYSNKYLSVKTKSEIVVIGNEFGLWEQEPVKAKLGDRLPEVHKKEMLIECFFLDGITTEVPQELLKREELISYLHDAETTLLDRICQPQQ